MIKIINLIAVVGAFIILHACVDDKTVDSFKGLNRVVIGGLEEHYSVMLYNNLQISPTIETTKNDDSHLSYIWYAYTSTSRVEADTLGFDKNLDVLVEPSILTPGEAYTLVLKVIDGETGVYYREERPLEIRTQFTRGTVLLCEEDGVAELNFIQNDENRTLLEDVYESANKELLGRNPQRIFSANPNAYAPFLKQELIFCQDENGGVVANPLSYEKIKSMRDACDNNFTTQDISPELYYRGGMIDYIIVNGIVCKRAVNMQAVNWEPGLVLMNEPREYNVEPNVLEVGADPVFFDKLHGRLITHTPWNQGSLKTFVVADNDPGIFDCNAFGSGWELKCWGALSEVTNGAWMLLKNTIESKFYLFKFSLESKKFRSISKIEVTENIAPHLNDAIGFAANSKCSDLFVYITKDAVYSFAANQLTSSTSVSLEVLQKDLQKEGVEATAIRFLDITLPAPTVSAPLATRVAQQIRLAVRDLNLNSCQGGVMFYEVNTVGGVHLEFVYKKAGFCDKVIDFSEKYE